METFKDLKEEITRIKALDVEGFDNDWVLRKFARDQALINIALIRPYADKYELIVRFLVTGKDTGGVFDATCAATYSAYAGGDADAAAILASITAAYSDAAYTTAYAGIVTDYTKAIESLTTLVNEYLALLSKEGE